MIGCFATSKAGHDKETVYVIVAEDKDYVYLCDGKAKTLDKPKRKNSKHIQPINQTIDSSLLQKLRNRENVTDEQIKYEIKCYQQKRVQ